MVDPPALLVVEDFDVAGGTRFLQKVRHDRTFVAVDEVVELAAKEVAGVGGDEV